MALHHQYLSPSSFSAGTQIATYDYLLTNQTAQSHVVSLYDYMLASAADVLLLSATSRITTGQPGQRGGHGRGEEKKGKAVIGKAEGTAEPLQKQLRGAIERSTTRVPRRGSSPTSAGSSSRGKVRDELKDVEARSLAEPAGPFLLQHYLVQPLETMTWALSFQFLPSSVHVYPALILEESGDVDASTAEGYRAREARSFQILSVGICR